MRKGGLYLALGDSITWAKNSGLTSGEQMFPTKMWRSICSTYGPVKLVNKGLGSNTSLDIVNSLAWATTLEPDIMTVAIGTNDASTGASMLASYPDNLRTIIDRLRRQNPNVVIVLCTPPRTTDPARTGSIADYRAAMVTVAAEKNVGLCQFETAWTAGSDVTYLPDNIHPNTAGHQLLYNVLWPIVQAQAATWLATLGK